MINDIIPMDFLPSIPEILIMSLMGFIGYFLRDFARSVRDLKVTVENIQIMFSAEQEKIRNTRESLESIKDSLDTSFNEIYNRVDNIEKDVAVLKFQNSNK